MQKQWYYVLTVTMIAAFLSSGFKRNENKHLILSSMERIEGQFYEFDVLTLHQHQSTSVEVPFIGNTFTGFKHALAHKESQGKYHKVNSLGYMGKYQFGASTLASIGVYDSLAFINNPKLQEKAFKALLSKNKWELRNYIKKYDGKEFNGVFITESGILAAAHLGGVGSVKKFFKSGGTRVKKDAYGTSIATYLKRFSGFDTYSIPAEKSAKVKRN
jgi:hypothetical protein